MATNHQVRFYPVGNGDCSQIVLANGRRVLMDYRHQKQGEADDSPIIDLSRQLLDELEEAGRDDFDVVAFTHADDDHICGSTDFFELRHSQTYRGEGRVKIQELWVPAAMLLETADNGKQSDEFVLLRQEARYRLLEGEGIRIFSKPPKLASWLEQKLKDRNEAAGARDHLFLDAGQLTPGFSLGADGVEFFCHSPFIKHCDDGDISRNTASLIFNVRFCADGTEFDYLAIGDAEWDVLEDIINITQYHGNDDRLAWNLFSVPHHCSYKALAEEKGEFITEPTDIVKTLLESGKTDAYIVSSSRPIEDTRAGREQVQPPHIQARKAYEKYLEESGGRRFLVTMEEPNASKPQPLIFDIGGGGVTWNRSEIMGAPAIVTSFPPRAGDA